MVRLRDWGEEEEDDDDVREEEVDSLAEVLYP